MAKIFKYIIPVLILAIVLMYSLYSKNSLDKLTSESQQSSSSSTVLQEIPSFSVYDLNGKEFKSQFFNSNFNAYYVHIWGTWCGPCESEFGDLLTYARLVKGKRIGFYLIAVNDELGKIQKFLKRFGDLPENVHVLIDSNNTVMDLLSTYKVPETFLFSKQNINKNKYVGPQSWKPEVYLNHLESIKN